MCKSWVVMSKVLKAGAFTTEDQLQFHPFCLSIIPVCIPFYVKQTGFLVASQTLHIFIPMLFLTGIISSQNSLFFHSYFNIQTLWLHSLLSIPVIKHHEQRWLMANSLAYSSRGNVHMTGEVRMAAVVRWWVRAGSWEITSQPIIRSRERQQEAGLGNNLSKLVPTGILPPSNPYLPKIPSSPK